jgi:hypothetical protein
MGSRTIHANDLGRVSLKRNPYQLAFLDALRRRHPDGSRHFHRLALFAGRRGGKTRIGAVAAAIEAAKPKTIGWACAPSYPELHDFLLPALKQTLPTAWIEDWSAENYEFTLINGSLIQCRSLDDPERGRGPGLHWAWLDETRKIQQLAWDTLRPALSEHRGVAWFTTSPNGKDWCYRQFWKRAQEGKPGWWALKYKTRENPQIPLDEIEEARDTLDPTFFRQEYEADFVNFTGSIYGGLLESQVIDVDREETLLKSMIPEWPRIDSTREAVAAIDPGADHPFACVVCLVTDFGLIAIGEYQKRYKAIEDHVLGIRRVCHGLQPRFYYDRTNPQGAIELRQHGIYALPSEGHQVGGIRRVQSWLRMKKLWFVKRLVPTTVEQMENLQWSESTSSTGEQRREAQKKIDDEGPDCVRYIVMSWPQLPTTEPAPSGRDISNFPPEVVWQIERMRRVESGERGDLVDLAEMHDPMLEEIPDRAYLSASEERDLPIGDFWM